MMVLVILRESLWLRQVLDSIVVSIPACHAGDRGSIPRRGDFYVFSRNVNVL